MKFKFLILSFVFSFSSLGEVKKDPVDFFNERSKERQKTLRFNPMENLVSGAAAFLIGNVGYALTDSGALQFSYTAIQTIGVINIGQAIYQKNSPSIERSFHHLLSNKKVKGYRKKTLANRLIGIFAKEERAKRLSLFYSSSLLFGQYMVNVLLYDSNEKIENIYYFLGGVNAIVALYSGLYKSSYEKYYFGEGIDINPFIIPAKGGRTTAGLQLKVEF